MSEKMKNLIKSLETSGVELMEMGYLYRGNYLINCAAMVRNVARIYDNDPVSPKQYHETNESIDDGGSWVDKLFKDRDFLRMRVGEQAEQEQKTLRDYILWCIEQMTD